jgi:sarcosine oxidase delta subunit
MASNDFLPISEPHKEDTKVTYYRTQKAKSIHWLTGLGLIEDAHIITNDEQLAEYKGVPYPETFARPCPVTPRHGFVDSRIVKTVAELRAVWREARAADPGAELALMSAINAAASAVLTPNAVVVGTGNDGATAGKAGSLTIPLAATDFGVLGLDAQFALEAIGITDTPYVESVQDKSGTVHVVQVRDGPKSASVIGDGSRYVTADCEVKHVIELQNSPDLLEWEQHIKRAPDGTAVYMPGGNMLSHYAIHAVQRGFPIVFHGDAPQIGDTLRANVDKVEVDVDALRKGITSGLMCEVDGMRYDSLMRVVFFGTHQSSALLTSSTGCEIVGIAAALFARFGTAACLGEWRHSRRSALRGKDRNSVYTDAFKDYLYARLLLRKAYRAFDRNKWSSGYGGRPWVNCTKETVKLDTALYDVIEQGLPKHVTALVKQLNINVNLAHNNGWWLNKFTSKGVMDAQARGSVVEVMKACYDLAPLVHTARGQLFHIRLSERIKLPLSPASVFQFKIKNGWVYMQFGYAGNFKHSEFQISKPVQTTLQSFIDALLLKEFKSFGSSLVSKYYRPTKAFWAALQLAEPETYVIMRTFIEECIHGEQE